MPANPRARARAPLRAVPAFHGGLLVLAGPALEGKWPLSAALHELLLEVVALGGPDDLGGPPPDDAALLDAAVAAWRESSSPTTTVLLTGRFATSVARRRAAAVARAERMAFLLVESCSSPIRSLRRVTRMFLSAAETLRRIERYKSARAAYVPVSADEAERLPALRLRSVLADVDDTAARVAHAWARV